MCKVISKPSLAKQTCRILSRYFGEDGKDKRPVNDLNNILILYLIPLTYLKMMLGKAYCCQSILMSIKGIKSCSTLRLK